MKALARTFNFATPAGGLVSAGLLFAFLALIIFALGGAGFRFDPFNSAERRADQAEASAAAATTDAAARQIEAAGARDTTTRVEVALQQAAAAEQAAFSLTSDARIAIDAKDPLDPDRSRRLRDVDDQLCAIRPAICAGAGDAAAPGNAGDRDRTLPPGRPAAG
ncbi:hypothetical protein D3C77_379320 [compost metagenome]